MLYYNWTLYYCLRNCNSTDLDVRTICDVIFINITFRQWLGKNRRGHKENSKTQAKTFTWPNVKLLVSFLAVKMLCWKPLPANLVFVLQLLYADCKKLETTLSMDNHTPNYLKYLQACTLWVETYNFARY